MGVAQLKAPLMPHTALYSCDVNLLVSTLEEPKFLIYTPTSDDEHLRFSHGIVPKNCTQKFKIDRVATRRGVSNTRISVRLPHRYQIFRSIIRHLCHTKIMCEMRWVLQLQWLILMYATYFIKWQYQARKNLSAFSSIESVTTRTAVVEKQTILKVIDLSSFGIFTFMISL